MLLLEGVTEWLVTRLDHNCVQTDSERDIAELEGAVGPDTDDHRGGSPIDGDIEPLVPAEAVGNTAEDRHQLVGDFAVDGVSVLLLMLLKLKEKRIQQI